MTMATTGRMALLSEDNPLIQLSITDVLEELGFTVVATDTAEAAWDHILQASDVDLLVTDIRLAGDLSGLELAYRAATQRPDIRILIVSGFPEDMVSSRRPRHYMYLPKPFSAGALAARVTGLMNTVDRDDRRPTSRTGP